MLKTKDKSVKKFAFFYKSILSLYSFLVRIGYTGIKRPNSTQNFKKMSHSIHPNIISSCSKICQPGILLFFNIGRYL
jgi:hypothetical protein